MSALKCYVWFCYNFAGLKSQDDHVWADEAFVQTVMTTSIMVQCVEIQCGTCICVHVCACLAMVSLPLQDT